MVVAVIDGGVVLEDCLYLRQLEFDLEVIDNRVIDRINKGTEHGTIVADLIQAYCADVKIGSIKIINENNECSNDYLITALRWCNDNEVKWIHMSVGTSNWKAAFELEKTISYLRNSNFIAARSNKGELTFPADIPNVWAIEKNWGRNEGENVYEYKANGAYKLWTSFLPPEELYKRYDPIIFYSNSYQAAIVTGKLLECKMTGSSFWTLNRFVKSKNEINGLDNDNRPPVIGVFGRLANAFTIVEYFLQRDYVAVMLYRNRCSSSFFYRGCEKINDDIINRTIENSSCDILFIYDNEHFLDQEINVNLKIYLDDNYDEKKIYQKIIDTFS